MLSLNFFKLKSASSLSLGLARTPSPSEPQTRRVRKPDGMLAPRPNQHTKFICYIPDCRADHCPTHNPHYPAPRVAQQHNSALSLRREVSAVRPDVPQLVVLPPSPQHPSSPPASLPTTAPTPPINQQCTAPPRSSSTKAGLPPRRSNAIRRQARGPGFDELLAAMPIPPA